MVSTITQRHKNSITLENDIKPTSNQNLSQITNRSLSKNNETTNKSRMGNSLQYIYKLEKCEKRTSINTRERSRGQDQLSLTTNFSSWFIQQTESVENNNQYSKDIKNNKIYKTINYITSSTTWNTLQTIYILTDRVIGQNELKNHKDLRFKTIDDPQLMEEYFVERNPHFLNQTQGSPFAVEPL